MEKVNLPTEKASEPNEEARQPLEEATTPKLVGHLTRKMIKFAEDTDNEKSEDQKSSQRSSTYKEVLSQPPASLSHRQKLLWLQKRRTAGLWAQCDDCNRWRFLDKVLDSYELPQKWYCRLNTDPAHAECSIPEAPIPVREEEDLIHSEYSAGSVVWARMAGFPWWPAMVDDCPDAEQFYWLDGFSDIPTHYNVVFFDSTDVTRAWIAPENLKPYTAYKNAFKPFLKDKKYKTRLQAAVNQADDAAKLPLPGRLHKYSFLVKYKGTVNTPKKVNKKELIKHQKYLKRRFNIEFGGSESDENHEVTQPKSVPKYRKQNKNVILVGTPKRAKTRATRTAKGKKNGAEVTTGKTAELVSESIYENIEAALEKMETGKTTEPTTDSTNYIFKAELEKMETGKTTEPTTDSTNDIFKAALEKMKTGKTTEPPTGSTNDIFKRPNSLAVQVGSTIDSAMVEEPFDDDTSKTYVPEESRESTQYTSPTVTTEITDFQVQVRVATPNSDDFDF